MTSSAKVWPKLQSFMKKECGVVLEDDQEYLLDARLGPVAQRFNNCSLAELVEAACTTSSSVSPAVIDALTTHESFFFRDQNFWRALEEIVLPQLIEKGRRLRFWSAACAHGQEPYSLAMLLEDRWPEVARSVEIIATDVSSLAIERAREGAYSSMEVNRGLPAMRLIRHFERGPGGFRVKPHLRERITWQVHNLLGANRDPADCDIVFCRNVLIYFSEQDRAATLARIEAAARPDGYIALGGSETSPRMQLVPGMYQRDSQSIPGLS